MAFAIYPGGLVENDLGCPIGGHFSSRLSLSQNSDFGGDHYASFDF